MKIVSKNVFAKTIYNRIYLQQNNEGMGYFDKLLIPHANILFISTPFPDKTDCFLLGKNTKKFQFILMILTV